MTARLVLLTTLGILAAGPGCVLGGGSDCSGACEKARECTNLDKTFLLDCSPYGGNCVPYISDCADCINARDCAALQAGACDTICEPGYCALACDKAAGCAALTKPYKTSCQDTWGSNCLDAPGACAACITASTCDQMVQGACDEACTGA